MPFPAAHPGLLAAITARGYTEPTPVQAAVLEERAAGRDLLVSAQTGSGKTVAFGLAIAPTLLGDAPRSRWSRSRPGVPTTIWAPCDKARRSLLASMPPTQVAIRAPAGL